MASGQCAPHQQAAHMAAPTEGQNIEITLANGEPSTHGATRTSTNDRYCAEAAQFAFPGVASVQAHITR
jgi:hypothetical protein